VGVDDKKKFVNFIESMTTRS